MYTFLKIWYYIKKYWWAFLILVVVIISAIGGLAFRKRSRVLLEILEKKKEFHDKEIDVLDRTRKKEIDDIKIATDVYNETLMKIDGADASARKKILHHRKKIVEKIVNDNINDSNKLAQDLADEYGFVLVEVNDD